MGAEAAVAAVEAATPKVSTKAEELKGALSELQKAMAMLPGKAPSVRAAGGGGGGVLPTPTGKYAPLPAMIPPFAVSAAAPANKAGAGGPHKEVFTIVDTGASAKNAAAAAGKARAEKMAGKKPAAA